MILFLHAALHILRQRRRPKRLKNVEKKLHIKKQNKINEIRMLAKNLL